jgi:hypothetical protein
MIKLKNLLKELMIVESGIRDIKKLAKAHKEADLYFHKDLDGVTSAIAMKAYLERYGIKITRAQNIQYGGREYAVDKPLEGRLAVIVDFAHGKPLIHIHTDHHDFQSGVAGDTSVSFKKSPSNVVTLSQQVSPSDIFPPEDVDLISIVDSADYSRNEIEVDRVLKTAFKFEKSSNLLKNRTDMGLVVNKVLLAFKSKPNFLEDIVMESQPSLISMYTTIMRIIKQRGYKYEDLEKYTQQYIQSQSPSKRLKQLTNPSQISKLRDGEYAMIGKCLVQYGGGEIFHGYDRYVPFKNNPDAEYLVIGWEMGLVQASKNPFKKGENPYDLGEIGRKIINKFKTFLTSRTITFLDLKKGFEEDIEKRGSSESFGFTSRDLGALFGDTVKGMPEGEKKELIDAISNKHYINLTDEEKEELSKVSVNVYDVIVKQSGGHRNITNISGLQFVGKDYRQFLKRIMEEFARELKYAKLK